MKINRIVSFYQVKVFLFSLKMKRKFCEFSQNDSGDDQSESSDDESNDETNYDIEEKEMEEKEYIPLVNYSDSDHPDDSHDQQDNQYHHDQNDFLNEQIIQIGHANYNSDDYIESEEPHTPIFNSFPDLDQVLLNLFHNNFNITTESIYSENEYNLTLSTFNLITGKQFTNIDIAIKNLIYKHLILRKKWPCIDDIVNELVLNKCTCLFAINNTEIKNILTHYIMNEGFIPHCTNIEHILTYQTINHVLPTLNELQYYLINQIQFNQDPESFYHKDKTHVPTLCINDLPIQIATCEESCAICQDSIEVSQEYIILKPCDHHFHHKSENCLGESSIINWLKENNYCPLCKTKITVN